MATNKEECKANLVEDIQNLCANMQKLLSTAKKCANDSLDEFVTKKIGCMLPMIGLYKDSFERVGVKTRELLDATIKQNFSCADVQDAFEELIQNENAWDSFLKDVDKKQESGLLSVQVTPLSVGGVGPNQLPLTDARTKQQVSLSDLLASSSGHLVVVLLRHFA